MFCLWAAIRTTFSIFHIGDNTIYQKKLKYGHKTQHTLFSKVTFCPPIIRSNFYFGLKKVNKLSHFSHGRKRKTHDDEYYKKRLSNYVQWLCHNCFLPHTRLLCEKVQIYFPILFIYIIFTKGTVTYFCKAAFVYFYSVNSKVVARKFSIQEP